MATDRAAVPGESVLAAPSPCPECQGLRMPAQVCSNLFLLTAHPALVPTVSSDRVQALVCIARGHITLYTKRPPGRASGTGA
jgi:hypothetical protein